MRGIYLPPARLHWSLFKLPEQLEFAEEGRDEVYWEMEKFLTLALKANPNVLETLWTPLVLHADEIAQRLRDMRSAFLSRHIYKTYSGYVLSQFRRMANAFAKTDTYKAKHAMHLVRLLYSGIEALTSGEIRIDVAEHREELLAIRSGAWSFEQAKSRALDLDREFQEASRRTRLPEQPDYRQANEFLIWARRRMVELDLEGLQGLVEGQDYAPLFVTVSGAHLYGFPSPDSDIDLRGSHMLPLRVIVSLDQVGETIERKCDLAGTEVELVSHDLGKYLRLLVKNNGYVLEQIFSPIVVLGHDFLEELRPLAKRCITRHHYHHYRGFLATQRKFLAKQEAEVGEDAALRVPRRSFGHPPAANGRGGGVPASPGRGVRATVHCRADRAEAAGEGSGRGFGLGVP